MSDERNTGARIVASRDGYRLVHAPRDQKRWPNVSDLTLERRVFDAMDEPHWIHVDRWCLSAQDVRHSDDDQTDVIALKMLLDPGPVVTTK